MPHFTLQLNPASGPLVTATVMVSTQRANALTTAGKPLPNPINVQALIDTGASCTCLDINIATTLQLQVQNMVPVNTPTTGNIPAQAPQYDAQLIIPPGVAGQSPLVFPTIPVVAVPYLGQQQGFQVLIGRDILDQCLLFYNGTNRIFSLAY